MVIYIDILFAVNMLMDMTIIWAAGMIMKERVNIPRILAGAAFGAFMYVITLYRPYINGVVQILVMLMSISLSLIIAYKPNNILRLVKLVLVSAAVSYIAAGLIFSILCFKAFYTYKTVSEILDNFSYTILIVSSILIYMIIKLSRNYLRMVNCKKTEYFDIDIYFNGISAHVRALADSGNSLKDNIGGNEVIICQYNSIKKFFPDNIKIQNDSVEMFKILAETSLRHKLRLIPFKSLGEDNGMLLGIKVDKAVIKAKEKKQIDNIIVCVYNGELDKNGLFDSIINYEIIF